MYSPVVLLMLSVSKHFIDCWVPYVFFSDYFAYRVLPKCAC